MNLNKEMGLMKKEEELLRNLTDMIKLTKSGKLNWKIIGQTTEYNALDKKPTVFEDGKKWYVDECYVSYECIYKGKEFLMITYEMIHSCKENKKTTNLVFLPPLGIRYFDLHVLLPYSLENDKMLTYEIHQLWLLLLELNRENAQNVSIDMTERVLVIEDEHNIKK